jgi:hypothetical protein
MEGLDSGEKIEVSDGFFGGPEFCGMVLVQRKNNCCRYYTDVPTAGR